MIIWHRCQLLPPRPVTHNDPSIKYSITSRTFCPLGSHHRLLRDFLFSWNGSGWHPRLHPGRLRCQTEKLNKHNERNLGLFAFLQKQSVSNAPFYQICNYTSFSLLKSWTCNVFCLYSSWRWSLRAACWWRPGIIWRKVVSGSVLPPSIHILYTVRCRTLLIPCFLPHKAFLSLLWFIEE